MRTMGKTMGKLGSAALIGGIAAENLKVNGFWETITGRKIPFLAIGRVVSSSSYFQLYSEFDELCVMESSCVFMKSCQLVV